jgi:hypothetical protein
MNTLILKWPGSRPAVYSCSLLALRVPPLSFPSSTHPNPERCFFGKSQSGNSVSTSTPALQNIRVSAWASRSTSAGSSVHSFTLPTASNLKAFETTFLVLRSGTNFCSCSAHFKARSRVKRTYYLEVKLRGEMGRMSLVRLPRRWRSRHPEDTFKENFTAGHHSRVLRCLLFRRIRQVGWCLPA